MNRAYGSARRYDNGQRLNPHNDVRGCWLRQVRQCNQSLLGDASDLHDKQAPLIF